MARRVRSVKDVVKALAHLSDRSNVCVSFEDDEPKLAFTCS